MDFALLDVSLCLLPHWYIYMAGVGDEKSEKTSLNSHFVIMSDIIDCSVVLAFGFCSL